MLTLREAGCRLFLWSTGGAEYCRQVAERYEMTPLFDVFVPKPDLYIDDMPSTFMKSVVVGMEEAEDWQAVADRVVRDYVAGAGKRHG